jgi:hypothetical protein
MHTSEASWYLLAIEVVLTEESAAVRLDIFEAAEFLDIEVPVVARVVRPQCIFPLRFRPRDLSDEPCLHYLDI